MGSRKSKNCAQNYIETITFAFSAQPAVTAKETGFIHCQSHTFFTVTKNFKT